MRQMRIFTCLISWLALWASSAQAQAQALSGAGSTFAAPLYVAAAEKLGSRHQFSLNYSSVGSAEGVKRIQEHTVDFGATDQPLSRQELNSSGLQFPTAIGGVVITANLPAFNVSHATDWT